MHNVNEQRFAELHEAIISAANDVKSVFDTYDIGHMELKIEVSGRVHGELKLSYKVCENYDEGVKGSDLMAVLDEYIRRRGWKERNAPLALPAPTPPPTPEPVANDDAAF